MVYPTPKNDSQEDMMVATFSGKSSTRMPKTAPKEAALPMPNRNLTREVLLFLFFPSGILPHLFEQDESLKLL